MEVAADWHEPMVPFPVPLRVGGWVGLSTSRLATCSRLLAVDRVWVEPATSWSRVRYSTNWTTAPTQSSVNNDTDERQRHKRLQAGIDKNNILNTCSEVQTSCVGEQDIFVKFCTTVPVICNFALLKLLLCSWHVSPKVPVIYSPKVGCQNS